jgi:hypothetical protein
MLMIIVSSTLVMSHPALSSRVLLRLLSVGKDNRECLCQTCEENGRGGWTEAGKPASPSPGKMTATPESPTAKRLKVSGRTLKIDSSESSEIDGAHAGSAEDNPSATAAAKVRL